MGSVECAAVLAATNGAGDGMGRAGAVIVYRRSTAGSEGAMRFGRTWSVHAPKGMS